MSKKTKILLFSFAGAFIISAIALASVLANFLVTPVTSLSSSAIVAPAFEIHFISLNKSQLKSTAQDLAIDARKINAGGYVWENDDYFYVLSSGFENKNDATLVQNNLQATQNIKSEILSVKFDSIALNGDFENRKVLEKAINSFHEAYKSLYDIAISLDTQVYNEISARLAVNALHSQLSTIKADFNTLFLSSDIKSLKIISSHLATEVQITENLCSCLPISKEQTYPSLIKYRYIELLEDYQNLIKELKD